MICPDYFCISCVICRNKELPLRQGQVSGSLEQGQSIVDLALGCKTKEWLLTSACVSLSESCVEEFRAAWVTCDILTVA